MAVYKATYCYPFLNAVDIRTAYIPGNTEYSPVQYLSCKVDTSNKNITGYKVRILNGNNQQIFPVTSTDTTDSSWDNISPISEFKDTDLYEENGQNSGINGTMLRIPFFQNRDSKYRKTVSFNSVYYKPQYLVDHIICDGTVDSSGKFYNNSIDCLKDYKAKLYDAECTEVWDLSSDKSYMTYHYMREENLTGDQVTVDDEVLMSGQAILVVSTNLDKAGLWTVGVHKIDNEPRNSYIMLSKFSSLSAEDMATVICGTNYHGITVKYLSDSSYQDVTSKDLWCGYEYQYNSASKTYSVQESDVKGFGVNGETYKWEITLYQGNGEIVTTEVPYKFSFDNVDNDWYDMVLTSGNILGSTPSRVQIAGPVIDSSNYAESLPNDGKSTLVLQTRYMQLQHGLNDNTGTRVYVNTYDASYGHAYPEDGSLDSTALNSANYCRFYKHSNNPEEIVDTDIADYGFSTYISLGVGNEKESGGVSTAFIYLKSGSTIKTSKGSYTLQDGDKILLTGQGKGSLGGKYSKQNGVYSYYSADTAYGEGGTLDDKTQYRLKRMASYNSWSSYIGAIIYCTSGDWGGQNVQSLASAGSYVLWDPTSSTGKDGDATLLFSAEKPILLFGSYIGNNRTFKVVDEFNPYGDTDIYHQDIIDGQQIVAGDLVLFSKGTDGVTNYAMVKQITYNNSVPTVTYYEAGSGAAYFGTISKEEYIYILSGEKYGQQVIQQDSAGAYGISMGLHTAKILKNGPQITYISPFTSIKQGMKLKLSNGNKALFIGQNGASNYTSEWLAVSYFNTTLWYILHDELAYTTNSDYGIDVRSTTDYGLASYSDSDSSIPWAYEVRSFFKTSDENPFYAYQSPYVLLYKNGEQFSDLSVLTRNFTAFDVLTDSSDYQDYDVKEIDDGTYLDYDEGATYTYHLFAVESFEDNATIHGRSVTLSAQYKQFQQVSWESYRWVLYNDKGEKIQDTEKKYDKLISVTFYGLANDTEEEVVYYAILYVEDSLNNELRSVIKLTVGSSGVGTLQLNFDAKFDCATQSVILSYQDIGILKPSYTYGNVVSPAGNMNEEAFVEGNNLVWDYSLKYGGDYVNITDVNYSTDAKIYYYGSDILSSDKEQNYDENISKPNKYGLCYSDFFSKNGEEVTHNAQASSDGSHVLSLTTNEDYDNQFYLDTEVELGYNFCGNFLSINIEGKDPDEDVDAYDPTVGYDGKEYLEGYLTIEFYTPDMMVKNGDIMVSDIDRSARVGIKLVANKGASTESYYKYNYNASTNPNGSPMEFQSTDGKSYFNWCGAPGKSSDGAALTCEHRSLYYIQKESEYNNIYCVTFDSDNKKISTLDNDRRMVVDAPHYDFSRFENITYNDGKLETYNVSSANLDVPCRLWMKKMSDGTYITESGSSPMGNLNLISSQTWEKLNPSYAGESLVNASVDVNTSIGPSYWVEDRAYIRTLCCDGMWNNTVKNPSDTYSFADVDQAALTEFVANDGSGLQKWPTDESKTYWNEYDNLNNWSDKPISWDDFENNYSNYCNISNTNFYTLKALDRHYTIHSDTFRAMRVRAIIYDVVSLYKLAKMENYSQYTVNFEYVTSTDDSGGNYYEIRFLLSSEVIAAFRLYPKDFDPKLLGVE